MQLSAIFQRSEYSAIARNFNIQNFIIQNKPVIFTN